MTRSEWSARPGRSSSWIRKSTRRAIYRRDGWRCVHCNKSVRTGGASLDHVVPRTHGGNNTARNLVTACLRCNSARHNTTFTTLPATVLAALAKPLRRSA